MISNAQGFRASPSVGWNWHETSATYDGDGNMLTSTYPSNRTIGYTYDELDRKKTITDNTGVGQNQSGPLIASYQYVGRYRVAQRDYGNATRLTYAYDGNGSTGTTNQPGDFGVRQVVRTTHTRIDPVAGTVLEILDDRTYTWDEMFNKTERRDVRFADSQLTHLYEYDAAYRLTFSMGVVADPANPGVPFALTRLTTYDLDGVHNRLSISGSPDPATGTYTMNATACDNLGDPLHLADGADRELNQYTATPFDLRG